MAVVFRFCFKPFREGWFSCAIILENVVCGAAELYHVTGLSIDLWMFSTDAIHLSHLSIYVDATTVRSVLWWPAPTSFPIPAPAHTNTSKSSMSVFLTVSTLSLSLFFLNSSLLFSIWINCSFCYARQQHSQQKLQQLDPTVTLRGSYNFMPLPPCGKVKGSKDEKQGQSQMITDGDVTFDQVVRDWEGKFTRVKQSCGFLKIFSTRMWVTARFRTNA